MEIVWAIFSLKTNKLVDFGNGRTAIFTTEAAAKALVRNNEEIRKVKIEQIQ